MSPFGALWIVIECVCVRIFQHREDLAPEEAFGKLAQFGVLGYKIDVGPNLIGAVSQPHGVDIAGDDEGVRVLGIVKVVFEDSRVERIGEGVDEGVLEFGVFDFFCDVPDYLLDDVGLE